MGNELVVLQTVKEVSSTLNTVLGMYKKRSIVRKNEMALLKVKIEAYLACAKANAASEILDNNMRIIYRTLQQIDEYNLQGVGLRYAMKQLEILEEGLEKELRNFMNR